MKTITHTFIQSFGEFQATATITHGQQARQTIRWKPRPDRTELLLMQKEYTLWMLENYKILARAANRMMGYAQPDKDGQLNAWVIYPSGRVDKIMEAGEILDEGAKHELEKWKR